MSKILIGFSDRERCNAVRNIVLNHGFLDIKCCLSGEEILRQADVGSEGIVICGLKVGTMRYHELYENLPSDYGMLLLVSGKQMESLYDDEVFTLLVPVAAKDLIRTIHMILEIGQKDAMRQQSLSNSLERGSRTGDDKRLIERAKLFLMNKYRISESAAHRFLQKNSMDSGRKMEETARLILQEDFFTERF